jgi:hypothetical protein
MQPPCLRLLRALRDELFHDDIRHRSREFDLAVGSHRPLVHDSQIHILELQVLDEADGVPVNLAFHDFDIAVRRLRPTRELFAFHYEGVSVTLLSDLRVERCGPCAADIGRNGGLGELHENDQCQRSSQ